MLNYYGFDVEPEWRLPNNRRIDLVARHTDALLLGIEVELTGNLKDDVDRLTSLNLTHRFIVTDNPISDIKAGNISIEIFSSHDLIAFEERIRQLLKVGNFPRYREIEIPIDEGDDCPQIINKFDGILQKAGFDVKTVKRIVYYEEIRSHGSGKILTTNKGVYSKEYNFLSSLGVWDYDYLTESDRSRWTQARKCIVKQMLRNRKQEIDAILSARSKSFNYILLVGTLGHIAVNYYQNMRVTVMENFESYAKLLTIPMNAQLWLSKVCEIESKSVLNYFEEWERSGIGVRADTGYFIPLSEMISEGIVDIDSWGDWDHEALHKFSLWYLLKEMSIDYRRERERIQREDSFKTLLEETAQLGYTSEMLPEPSKELFSVYDRNKYIEYCESKMLEYARKVLEI